AFDLLAALMGEQSRKLPRRLADIDEFLLAISDRLGGILGRSQVERLAMVEMRRDATDAEAEALAQHRHRDGAAHHRPRLVGGRLAAVIVVAGLDRGEAEAERAVEIEEAPPGQAVARCGDGGLLDRLPEGVRKLCLPAVQVIHGSRSPFAVEPADGEAGALCRPAALAILALGRLLDLEDGLL